MIYRRARAPAGTAQRSAEDDSVPWTRSRVAGTLAADESRRLPEHPRLLEIRVYKRADSAKHDSNPVLSTEMLPQVFAGIKHLGSHRATRPEGRSDSAPAAA